MAGRKSIGDQPLTKTEKQQRWRRRKVIFKEECEKVGAVTGVNYCFDRDLLAVFELMANKFRSISVDELLFIAMKDYLIAGGEGMQEFCSEAGIEDIKSHKQRLNRAKVNTLKRLKDEGLYDPRIKEARND